MQFLILEGFVNSRKMAESLAGSSIARTRSKNWLLESGSARKMLEKFWLENGSTRKMLEKFWLETRLGSKIFGSKCSSNENFGSVPSLLYIVLTNVQGINQRYCILKWCMAWNIIMDYKVTKTLFNQSQWTLFTFRFLKKWPLYFGKTRNFLSFSKIPISFQFWIGWHITAATIYYTSLKLVSCCLYCKVLIRLWFRLLTDG